MPTFYFFNRDGMPIRGEEMQYGFLYPFELKERDFKQMSTSQASTICAAMGEQVISVRSFEELDLLLDFIRIYRGEYGTGVFVADIDVSMPIFKTGAKHSLLDPQQ